MNIFKRKKDVSGLQVTASGTIAGSNAGDDASVAPQGLVQAGSEGLSATQNGGAGANVPTEVKSELDAESAAQIKANEAEIASIKAEAELGCKQSKIASVKAKLDTVKAGYESEVAKAEVDAIICRVEAGEDFNVDVALSNTKVTEVRAANAMPQINMKSSNAGLNSDKVLEARALMATGGNIEKMGFNDQTVEAAQGSHSLSLRGLIADTMKASGNGSQIPELNDTQGWMRAAASTANLPKILGNIANKTMKQDFMENKVVEVIKNVCLKQSPTDFKTNTGVSLGSTGSFGERGSGGRFEFAKLTEDAHTFRVLEKGVDFGITRQMIINDDLNMFMSIPREINKLAMRQFITDFHTLLADGGSVFFKADHATNEPGTTFSNVNTSGAGVDLAGYDLMTGAFAGMLGPDGQPIDNTANIVLTPATLGASARTMYNSTDLFSRDKANTKTSVIGQNNPYSNMYEPQMSNRLTGTTYYGITNPNELAAFYVSYLNGMETPSVFQWMENGTLDRMFTAVFDYGFDYANPQACVRMSS